MGIRLEESADWTAIYAIYAAAFGQLAEADLVLRLRDDGDLVLSLMAFDEEPIGHVVFSRLIINEMSAVNGCVLAPVATVPARQRQGIGAVLIEDGLRRLKADGFDLVMVLGEPEYYGRFGFSAEAARPLNTPYDGPYLQALALSETGLQAKGSVTYARAFAELK